MARIRLKLRSANTVAEFTFSTNDNSHESTVRDIRVWLGDILHVHSDILKDIESATRNQYRAGSHEQTITVDPPAIAKLQPTQSKDPLGVELTRWLDMQHGVICRTQDYTGILNGLEQVISNIHQQHINKLHDIESDLQQQIALLKNRNTQLEQGLHEYHSLQLKHAELDMKHAQLTDRYEQERHAHIQAIQSNDSMAREHDQVVEDLYKQIRDLHDQIAAIHKPVNKPITIPDPDFDNGLII
jgi:hypothetical protein